MQEKHKIALGLTLTMIVACALMYGVEIFLDLGYTGKSICKVALFLLLPLGYSRLCHGLDLKRYFQLASLKSILPSLALGGAVYLVIIGSYFLVSPWIDLAHIASLLESNLNVNAGNFLLVALYISFINSLLEEFFFRGFLFLTYLKVLPRGVAYGVSALAFAIYHVAILAGWFGWILSLVVIGGLFIGGVLFNWLDEKSENLYNSWLVHMCANFATNTIAFLMFAKII